MSKTISLFVTVSLLACVALRPAFASAGAAVGTDKSEPSYETRVYVRTQCLLSESKDLSKQPGPEFLPALAAIFLPLLIEKAIGGISAALKKAGSEEVLKDSGRLPTYLYQLSTVGGKNVLFLNSDFGCVLLVRGAFNSPDNPDKQSTIVITNQDQGIFLDPADEGKRIKRLQDNGIPVREIAALYEAKITIANDQTALLYESRVFEMNAFQGNRSHDTRAVVVSVAISSSGEKEGEPTLSLVLVNLGDIKEKTILGPDKLSSKRTSWVGGLGISDASLKAMETIKYPGEKPGPLGIMPVTLEGVFAETDKGNKALLFIAEVLYSTKGDVSKAISAEILKDRSKAAAEASDALEKLRQEEEAAYGDYLKAKVEYETSGLPDPLPGDLKLTTAQKVTIAERDRTLRLWCLKFKTLDKLGKAPTGRDSGDCK